MKYLQENHQTQRAPRTPKFNAELQIFFSIGTHLSAAVSKVSIQEWLLSVACLFFINPNQDGELSMVLLSVATWIVLQLNIHCEPRF